jgi:hypothetical protein
MTGIHRTLAVLLLAAAATGSSFAYAASASDTHSSHEARHHRHEARAHDRAARKQARREKKQRARQAGTAHSHVAQAGTAYRAHP